jgi:predicted kinase
MTTWVLLAGLPGTGKSTLARKLQEKLGGVVLDKDRVREALFPGTMTDYSREQDDLCMQAILEAAIYLSQRNRAPYIFLDGRTFSRRQQIEDVLRIAQQFGVAWRIVLLQCAEGVVMERLGKSAAEHPAGNRNFALYQQLKTSFEAITYPRLDVDTTKGVDGAIEDVTRYLTGARR